LSVDTLSWLGERECSGWGCETWLCEASSWVWMSETLSWCIGADSQRCSWWLKSESRMRESTRKAGMGLSVDTLSWLGERERF